MKLCGVEHFQSSKLDFPLIKTWERIRFSSNQNIGEGEPNFENWKCPTQQSFIPQDINSLLIIAYEYLSKAKKNISESPKLLHVICMYIPTVL